jgi:hypothetical protein
LAFLQSLNPFSELYSTIHSRGYKLDTFFLTIDHDVCSEANLRDGVMIQFEEIYFTVSIQDCPQLTRLRVPSNSTWTALQEKLKELGYPDDAYTCRVNSIECTNDNLFLGATIGFNTQGLGGGIGGEVSTDPLLDDVAYPDSSSSSDSDEEDSLLRHQYIEDFVQGKGALNLAIEELKTKLAKLTEYSLNRPVFDPPPEHASDGREDHIPPDDDLDWKTRSITGDKLFPPHLKNPNPKQGEEVSFQDGKHWDAYEYYEWERKWVRITLHASDEENLRPLSNHEHHHNTPTEILDAEPELGENAWRINARLEGQSLTKTSVESRGILQEYQEVMAGIISDFSTTFSEPLHLDRAQNQHALSSDEPYQDEDNPTIMLKKLERRSWKIGTRLNMFPRCNRYYHGRGLLCLHRSYKQVTRIPI